MAAHAVCLFVAGVLRATVPADDFMLAWQHSVQKTQWEERYAVEDEGLRLFEARVQGSGAGMEAGDAAVLRNGWWTWQPDIRIAALILSASHYTPDYLICTARRCQTLRDIVGGASTAEDPVTLRACSPQ